MSEEQQEQSTGGSIKNIIIGLVSTITRPEIITYRLDL